MRPFRNKTIIEAVDKASKVINKIYTSAKRMSTGITKDSQIAGSAFNRFTNSIGMGVKKATVSINDLNARINRVGYNIKKSLGTLGLAVGFTAIAMGVGGVIKTFANFEQANANLASVMATATQPELNALQIDAKRLGAITARTSTEVVGLQESLARLGFETPEILNMTQSIISGSVAMQGELSETADLVGAMVKSFDAFESINTPEIVDQMTVATQKSALNFEKLQTMLPTVAGAANAAGIPFNKLLALLGKLSDAGIDASSSSTALRNIILESGKQGKNYEEILADIVSQQDKLTTSMNEFGVRAAVPATILAGKLNETLTLSEDIMNSVGAAANAEAKTLDTLTGATTILGSAWEGYILSIEDGKGAIGGFLKDAIKMTTEVLSIATGTEKLTKDMTDAELRIRGFAETAIKVLKVIKAAVITFIAFKAVVISLRIATFAYNVVLGIQSALLGASSIAMKGNAVAIWVMNAATKAMAVATLLYNTGLSGAIAATWAFTAALLANPMTWVVIGIAALVAGIVLLVKHWDVVKAAVINFWNVLKNTAPIQFLISAFQTIKSVVGPIIMSIMGLFRNMWELIKAVGRFIGAVFVSAFTPIVNAIKFVWNIYKSIFTAIINLAGKLVEPFKPFVSTLMNIGTIIKTYIIEKFKQVGAFVSKIIDSISKFFGNSANKINAKTEQILTVNDERKAESKIANTVNSTITNKNEVLENQSTKNKVIENEAIKTDSSDKLTDAILLNAKITGENTEIQKVNKDEWKGKFKTYIAKDANITEMNITSELAKTAIKNENNVITKQSELLSKTAVNESNVLNNSENNIINKTSLNELNKSNINTRSTELVKNLVNESNFIQSDIIKENEITKNVANITNTDFVTQRDLVEQKDVQNVRNESNVSNQTNRNNQNEGGKITINVVDKTGGNYALEVESTGVNVITTGNG